jgi:tagatose 1,6-diphosphate aldolase
MGNEYMATGTDHPALTPGKRRGVERIAGADGRFRMLATDQRGSLMRVLARRLGCAANEVPPEALREVKRAIIEALTPSASGLLTDPVYGFAAAMDAVGKDTGLLFCIDESGSHKLGQGKTAQISRRLENFSVERTKLIGADGVKVLVPYRPDADDGSREYQEHYVRQIGAECARWDIPFVLEIVAYERNEPGKDSPEYALGKPRWVVESARVFSRPEFRADILKLEFPADLRFVHEFADGAFDGVKREPVYALTDAERFCREVDAAASRPWVILSAGVGYEEFCENVRLACAAGASGFLCGRALWQEGVALYPDADSMRTTLRTRCVEQFVALNALAERAVPWFDHRSIGGRSRLAFSETTFA